MALYVRASALGLDPLSGKAGVRLTNDMHGCTTSSSSQTRMSSSDATFGNDDASMWGSSSEGGHTDERDGDFGIGLEYLSDLDDGAAAARPAPQRAATAATSAPPRVTVPVPVLPAAAAAAVSSRGGAVTAGQKRSRSGAASDTTSATVSPSASSAPRARGGKAAAAQAPRPGSTTSAGTAPVVVEMDRTELRREWNRTNARKSRARKRFLVDTMMDRCSSLGDENTLLRALIAMHAPEAAVDAIARGGAAAVAAAPAATPRLQLGSAAPPTAQPLHDSDFALIDTVARCHQHFIITDPLSNDNPIVFASQGFYDLTGYTSTEILGFNCRFLQGRDTDARTVARMRYCLDRGLDTDAVVLNYRKDGTPFWNHLFMAPLRNSRGDVVHYVGVQCNIPAARAADLLKLQAPLDAAFEAAVTIAPADGKPAAAKNHDVFVARLAAHAAAAAAPLRV